jgi:hypothetical protein
MGKSTALGLGAAYLFINQRGKDIHWMSMSFILRLKVVCPLWRRYLFLVGFWELPSKKR